MSKYLWLCNLSHPIILAFRNSLVFACSFVFVTALFDRSHHRNSRCILWNLPDDIYCPSFLFPRCALFTNFIGYSRAPVRCSLYWLAGSAWVESPLNAETCHCPMLLAVPLLHLVRTGPCWVSSFWWYCALQLCSPLVVSNRENNQIKDHELLEKNVYQGPKLYGSEWNKD